MRALLIALVLLAIVFFTFIIGIAVGSFMWLDGDFSAGDRLAVLTFEEIIVDSDEYLKTISEIERDDNIKAVVLRVNTPGGAVAPSQEIYSELKRLGEIKPVVASIGAVGASGGYYIAIAAEKIYANPGSITGSIGVIAKYVNYEELLKWAKLDVEIIKSGKFKDVGSPVRKMTDEERRYIQDLIDSVQLQFAKAVSEERDMKLNEVYKIADGRIFTGEQALRLNLIDDIGSLNDAIRYTGALVELEDMPEIEYFPKEESEYFDIFSGKLNLAALKELSKIKTFGLYYLVDIMH